MYPYTFNMADCLLNERAVISLHIPNKAIIHQSLYLPNTLVQDTQTTNIYDIRNCLLLALFDGMGM